MTVERTVPDGYRGRRVLVLGASGFIGRWVARLLGRAGASLVVAVRDEAAFRAIADTWEIDSEVFAIDMRVGGAVDAAVAHAAPDIAFNLAGYGVDRSERDPVLMRRLNTDLVRDLAASLAGSTPGRGWGGLRLVHAGSALEYGLVEGRASEEAIPRPHTEYGRTKLAGTGALAEVAQATGLACVTARAFTVFGSGEHPGRLLPALRRAARSGGPVRLSGGEQRRDFAYVEDVASAMLRLGLQGRLTGDVVNVATGRMTSVRAFAERAGALLGIAPDRLQFGAEPARDDEMRITGVAVERLRGLTGFVPDGDLDATLTRALAFEDPAVDREDK